MSSRPLAIKWRLTSVLMLFAMAFVASGWQQPSGDTVRDVWPPGFRPQPAKAVSTPRRDRYRRATPAQVTNPIESAALGITIWKLRPSKESDEARILVTKGSKKTPFTPERVESSTSFVEGQMLRLGIEVPRSGYLYVIDREEYANGAQSEPYLIFPLNPAGTDHRVAAGQVIEVPNQGDPEAYFEVKSNRGPGDSEQINEILTVLVTPTPLQGIPAAPASSSSEPQPIQLTQKQVAEWERLWSVKTERLELEGGSGMAYTRAEQTAGSSAKNRLSPEDAPPQTVFRLATSPDKPYLVKLPLRVVRK
ncbi:MAG: hypothetical protein ABI882_03515 [Acidobacteriota bacterium]